MKAGLFTILVFSLMGCLRETETPVYLNNDMSDNKSLTIRLHAGFTEEHDVYLTGNFNSWNPADAAYRLERTGEGTYEYSFEDTSALPDSLEYKFTRGGWENVELDTYGNEPHNRTLASPAPLVVSDTVSNWRNGGLAHRAAFRPLINIISEEFKIPQLIKTRRITALLPYDYYKTDKRYPVLYLQDGQNLFDDHAPFGSWEMDKRLAFLAERGLAEFIVIAIDHAEEERLEEFNPTVPTSKLGPGDGQKYARFLAETLKPFIDSHFRTKPQREFTGIGGSSMGGLISIYAVMEHPEIYSRLLLFSPSFWVTPALPKRFVDETTSFEGRIYIYGGGRETKALLGRLNAFKDQLDGIPGSRNVEAMLSINPTGTHSESEWSREFPKAAVWLFGDEFAK